MVEIHDMGTVREYSYCNIPFEMSCEKFFQYQTKL